MDDLSRLNLLGSSEKFLGVCSQIKKMASVDVAVLIAGETGTGKEVAARALHYLGKRRDQPFIPVNCGALPETLIESELFGHERGAFTDAKTTAPGLVCEANGGTLFLDEVDTLSPKAQASMLRFLQDHSYRRVGSGIERKADVRVIVASNANLEQLVETKAFRRDLLYRLNVLHLRLPALRERGGDAIELAQTFLTRLSHQYRLPKKTLHPSAIEFISQYDWPGNIRELENVMHREFLMCEGDEIIFKGETSAAVENTMNSFKNAKQQAIAEFEQRYLRQALEKSAGNLSEAARMAGQDRSAFGKLVRKHKILGMEQSNL